MLAFIKKKFIGLLTGVLNAFNHTKCVSLDNEQCTTQPTLVSFRS